MALDDVHSNWFSRIDQDLLYLTTAFQEVLLELGEADLAAVLPWIDAPAAPGEALAPERELQVLSIAFQLLNLVEESAAVQARRFGEVKHGVLYEPGMWGQSLQQLVNEFPEEAIAAQLQRINVDVVLTAHPTEAKRPIVLKQHRALFELLQKLGHSQWSERERERLRGDVKVVLERLWRTGEIHLYKPDVKSELDHILDFFRAIFPAVLPVLDERLRVTWRQLGLDESRLREPVSLPRLRFGNWVGGDRDGHPLVTAEVTRHTLQELRTTAVDGLRQLLLQLRDSLSLSDLFQTPPGFLAEAVRERATALGVVGAHAVAGFPREAWRQFAALMLARLPGQEAAPGQYVRPAELSADLDLLRLSLDAVGAQRLAAAEVAPIERVLEAFGFHTAALDIRQNSAYHDTALGQMLQAAGVDAAGFEAWDEARRREFLCQELRVLRPLAPRSSVLGKEARELLDTYEVVAEHIERHGRDGVGAFIISMTRDLSDLLVVYVLLREVGLLRMGAEGIHCTVPVVPLFETVDDLERSPKILRDFLEHPITRRSLEQQPVAPGREAGKPVQQVMVGYSDSSKGSGLLTSHWCLNRAQRALTLVGAEVGVDIQFFHGRGGTLSRGAGPTHRFLESLAEGSLSGTMRVTEQGETIAQKYGHLPTAIYNLELLLAGVTVTTMKHQTPKDEDPRFLAVAEQLSGFSEAAYQDLLQQPDFLPFWAEATPIDALEQSFIGSRPTRRTGQRSLNDLRAIPWVFSWIQSRFYLTSWYGIGSALERLHQQAPEQFALLQEHIHQLPFLRYVLYNAETSLASADPALMREYASLVRDESIRESAFARILGEYTRAGQMIDQIFGAPRHERRPRMVKTLQMREEGLRRLHHRQIALLRTWRAHKADGDTTAAEAMIPALLLSVNAIASGQRTTG